MKSTFEDQLDLIRHLKEGDESAFNHLMDLYHHKLCVYAHSLAHDKDIAEDIVQNVFVRIWEKRKKLKDDFVLGNFLYKSVFNEFVDAYRTRKFVTRLDKKYLEALDYVIEEDEEAVEKLYKLVLKEIKNLPPKCREIFLMSKRDGLTNMEIASLLNVSLKTVEAHITQGFKRIRENLQSDMDINPILFLLFGHFLHSKNNFKVSLP